MSDEINTIRGIVREIDGGDAVVEVEQGGCGRCHEKGGCGGQQLTQMFCSGPKTYLVDNRAKADVGERVVVALSRGGVRRTANLAYGTPLIAAISGAVLGSIVGGDVGSMVGAAAGLVVSFAYVRYQGATGKFAERPYIISRS